MKQIDTKCPACGHVTIDVLLRVKDEAGDYVMPVCRERTDNPERLCGTLVERVHIGHSGYVVGDDIPGGYWVKHGICNPDGSPKRYDTKSSMREAARAAGLVNLVQHQPRKGGDRNKHTQRFV